MLLLLVCVCALQTVCTLDHPSYISVQNLLHQRIGEIFENEHGSDEVHLKVHCGKFFRYTLNDDGVYEAYEVGTNRLPSWLTFDSKKNKLFGVPTDRDAVSGLQIEFRTQHANGINGEMSAKKDILIDVVSPKKLFDCGDEPNTVASIVFHSNLANFDGAARTKVLRRLVSSFDFGINSFYLEWGNRMDDNGLASSSIRMAGPGSLVSDEQPGFTISWRLKCGYDVAGHKTVGILRQLSQEENFYTVLKVPVLGWFVSSTKPNRVRRAVGLSGTPGATPVASVTATKKLGPSPSVSVKSTSMVKPTPSKSIEIMMTSTTPPTTKPTASKVKSTTPTTKPTTSEVKPTKPTTSKVKPTPGNRSPEKVSNIQDIYIFENQGLVSQLPSNLFYDADGDLLSIELQHVATKLNNATRVDKGYWIEYHNKDLYMLPIMKDIGVHRFMLKASDPSGLYVNAMFTVHVQRDDAKSYNNLFNVTLDIQYASINNSVLKKMELLQTLATALQLADYKSLRAIEFLSGSVIIRWGIESLKNVDCNNAEVPSFVKQLSSSEFIDSFVPYDVLSSGMTQRKECVALVPPDNAESKGLWKLILIPVVVVVIILLIILLIVCCVCRRKRKYSAHSEEEIYLNQKKKPIIFEEEKHKFLSLTSTSLSDDNTPNNQNYGDSDGPGSSTTVSTDSDGKALLTPSSPKEKSRGYNSPPPYGS